MGGVEFAPPPKVFVRQKSIFKDIAMGFAPNFKLGSCRNSCEEKFSKNFSEGGPRGGQKFQNFSKKNFFSKVVQNRLKRILV